LLGKYSMQITEQSFTISEDLAEKITALAQELQGIECHNKGGWQGNFGADSPQWAHELVADLNSQFEDYTIHGLWFNINGPGHSNRMHRHYVNSMTGVLYVQVPQDSGHVVFQQGQERVCMLPKPGTLLTFPGDIMHGVDVNLSSDQRITVAFNLVTKKAP